MTVVCRDDLRLRIRVRLCHGGLESSVPRLAPVYPKCSGSQESRNAASGSTAVLIEHDERSTP